jgi:hypothetical protein
MRVWAALERPGVEHDLDVAAVVPGSAVDFGLWLRAWKADDESFLFRRH